MKAYESCHEPFLRYCSALAYGKMDTEDLVQDVLLSAYHHFDKIDQEKFLHYLIRAARNRSVSWFRKKRPKEVIDTYAERLAARGVSPEVLVDVQLLYRTLNRLPQKQKDALLLFEVSGFSLKEIAKIQKSSPGAVKTSLSRGRKRLRELLAEKSAEKAVPELFQSLKMLMLCLT